MLTLRIDEITALAATKNPLISTTVAVVSGLAYLGR